MGGTLMLPDEKGSALLATVLVSVIVFTLGMGALALSVHQNETARLDHARNRAFHAAEAGVSQVVQRFSYDFPNAAACGAGASPPASLKDGTRTVAKFRFQIEGVPSDPGCLTDQRLVRAWGYVPQAGGSVFRQLEVFVEAIPSSGFSYALFAGLTPGTLSLKNTATVTGDVYAESLSQTNNNLNLTGDVTSPGSITTKNDTAYGGNVVAGGSITIGNNGTISGSVRAATGSVSLGNGSSVEGTVRAGTTISGDCGSTGGCVPNSPSAVPTSIPMPTFAYDALNYSPTPTVFTSVSLFNTFMSNSLLTQIAGTYYITDPSATPPDIDLTRCKQLVGNTTVIADRNAFGVAPKINIGNGPPTCSWTTNGTAADPHQFVVISTSTAADAIHVTSQLTLPTNVGTLLYTPGGVTIDKKIDALNGSIYATSIGDGQGNNITVSASPDLAHNPPPGFTFPTSAVSQWEVQTLGNGWREINPGTLPDGSI